jgi:3-deoxy-7-phosphoheptulonate synthase
MFNTDDVRIKELKTLAPPSQIMSEFVLTDDVAKVPFESRAAIHKVLHGADDRLVVVIGPCSIHDPKAALDYCKRLLVQRELHKDTLEIVMRVYFEKPRTTVGWKGLINDPDLNETFDINKGLRIARELLLEINTMGMPAAVEFLDMITPQYIADLVSWGAIGARTTESQVHRELSSGMSCPIGFKNGTDGNVKIAVDATLAAQRPHHFLSVTKEGMSAIVSTNGNEDCHVILRGGKTPNYDAAGVQSACEVIAKGGLAQRVMVDASHANAEKKPENQTPVCANIAAQVAAGDERIFGLMIESNIVGGRQDLVAGAELTYGQSITDGCIDWDASVAVLQVLADAVKARREVVRNNYAEQ